VRLPWAFRIVTSCDLTLIGTTMYRSRLHRTKPHYSNCSPSWTSCLLQGQLQSSLFVFNHPSMIRLCKRRLMLTMRVDRLRRYVHRKTSQRINAIFTSLSRAKTMPNVLFSSLFYSRFHQPTDPRGRRETVLGCDPHIHHTTNCSY
jgi:hypothetical protein